jgi:uncharacterized protein (TIGR02996 family)
MTHHEGFLADIIEHPADDTPRLVYADWLEEHSDPGRAEFIRTQCAAERLRAACLCGDCVRRRGGGQHHNGRCALDRREHGFPGRRERELLLRYCLHYLPPAMRNGGVLGDRSVEVILSPRWEYSDTPGVLFRRGFVAEVTLPCQAWLEHGPALVRAVPLERVTLADRQPSRWYRLGWGEWYWVRQAGPTLHVPDRLPPELCDLLSTGRVDEDGVMTYLSRERAQDALSRACLEWARDVMVPGCREGV